MERREFISTSLIGAFGFSFLSPKSLKVLDDALKIHSTKRLKLEENENFWASIRSAFEIDNSIINLNNAGVSPSPATVHKHFLSTLNQTNRLPSYYMWKKFEKEKENVRKEIAKDFGVDPEEIAITRNASEALEIVQQGMDFSAGDEVLTTTQDYFRMLNTWNQIERRRGVIVNKIKFPAPLLNEDELLKSISKNISKNTKLIHVSHAVYLTGQILPILKISKIAQENSIKLLCDGAHSFFHFPFKHSDINSDFFGTSLHKWCYAPIGTGFLHIKKEMIKDVWPLMGSPKKMDDNIRKFEEIGTHPAANHNGILSAIEFNRKLGIKRKVKRLQYLNSLWIDKVKHKDNLNILTDVSNPDRWGGIVLFNIESADTRKLYKHLLDNKKIFVTPIIHKEFEGIRVSPNIYTSEDEINIFTEAIEEVISGKVNLSKS